MSQLKFLLLFITLLLPSLATASGTLVPPPIPDHFKDIPINDKIKIGKALFNGKPTKAVEPLPGPPCSECHSGKTRLKRKKMKKIRAKLKEIIGKEHRVRYEKEGDPLGLISIYYYMYTRWRLDR